MKLSSTLQIIISAVILFAFLKLGLIFISWFPGFSGSIEIQDSAVSDLGNRIVIFSFISLALQSSMNVIVTNLRGSERSRKLRKIQNINEDILEVKQGLREQAELPELRQRLEVAEDELDLYRDETKALLARLSLVGGIAVSVAGIRLLQPVSLLELGPEQTALFHVVDILLTGCLLAGGSAGIHRLTQVYEEFTKIAQKNSQQAKE